jgi:hypothetical protein
MPKVKSESNAKGNALCCVNIRKIRLYLSDPFRDTTRRPPPPPPPPPPPGGGGGGGGGGGPPATPSLRVFALPLFSTI